MSIYFLLGLSFILTHELDAMTAKEWRIFPGLSLLDDERGRQWFVALHIPLFAVLLWGLTGAHQKSWIWGFDIFTIVHLVAHILMHKHSENGFRRPLSWFIIVGAAVMGGVDLWSQSSVL